MNLHSVVRRIAIAPALMLGCAGVEGPAPEEPVAAGAVDARVEAGVEGRSLPGVYRVRGSSERGKLRRRVTGYVVIRQTEQGYVSSYSLLTRHQSGGRVTSGELVGYGRGELDGGRLSETTRMQSVTSTAADVDVRFPFVPRKVGPRGVSSTTGRLYPDGGIALEIAGSRSDDGEPGALWLTRLEGWRITPGKLPPSVRTSVLLRGALAGR